MNASHLATVLWTVACLLPLAACGSPEPKDAPVVAAPGGMQLVGPFTHEALDVWLVKGPESAPLERAPIPLEAALEQGLVVVHETGQVDEASVSLPTHPGAQAFYDRDKPSFIQENAEPLALMVTVFAMLLSSLESRR